MCIRDRFIEVEAVFGGVLGFVEVPSRGDVQVGAAEVVDTSRFKPSVVGAPGQVGGFLVERDAVGVALFMLDVGEVGQADGECADEVSVGVVQLVAGLGERVGGGLPVPVECEVLQVFGGGPVPVVEGDFDPVFGEQAPLVFAVGQGLVGVGVGEVGGEVVDEAGPFVAAAGVAVERPEALHGLDDEVPPVVGAGEVEGVEQVGLLGGNVVQPPALPVFFDAFVAVGAEAADGGGVGVGDVEGSGGVGGSVGGGEQPGEVPGQGGVR